MKQKRVFLDELDNTARAYKFKVKVIEKGRPKKSPAKGTLYQSLVIEDDKGNRMRGALFGDQIDSYKEAFVYNGTYDIANAPIRRCDPQWKRDKDDLDYQMTFGNETVIQPLEQPNKDTALDYKTISQIPKTASDDEKYGSEACDIIVSCERAATLAVVDLINKYQLTVRDITAARKGTVKTCVALRTLRRLEQELDRDQMKKAWDTVAEGINEPKTSNPITIDYIDTMYRVLKKIELNVEPIEIVEDAEGRFLAWVVLPTSARLKQPEYIFGPTSKSRQTAQNRLARKVIIFLIPIYNLQIVDANYNRNSLGNEEKLKENTNKLYLTAKEVIHPFNDKGEYAIVDLPAGYSTPTDDEHQITTAALKHPPPPKKRRCCLHSDALKQTASTSSPEFFKVPDNLVAMFDGNPTKQDSTI